MNIDIEMDKIAQADFFSKIGVKEFLGADIILLKDVEQAFVNPTQNAFAGMYKAVKWLPSALTDTDPFYKNIQIPENLLPYRKEIVQFFLKKHRNLKKNCFHSDRMTLQKSQRKQLLLLLGNIWSKNN